MMHKRQEETSRWRQKNDWVLVKNELHGLHTVLLSKAFMNAVRSHRMENSVLASHGSENTQDHAGWVCGK